MDEIQTLLGLPTLDRTKTRQLVRAYFELYRQYKWLLSIDIEPHLEQRARVGYEDAMDPRFIRGNSVYSDGPQGFGTSAGMQTSEDEYRRVFCARVERKVDGLRDYQRDIVRHQYMYKSSEQRPTDDQTYITLKQQGWYVGKRFYEQEKATALSILGYAFGLARYRG